MTAMNVKMACMEYLNHAVKPQLTYGLAGWKVTEKSLVYYHYTKNEGTEKRRVVVPLHTVMYYSTQCLVKKGVQE